MSLYPKPLARLVDEALRAAVPLDAFGRKRGIKLGVPRGIKGFGLLHSVARVVDCGLVNVVVAGDEKNVYPRFLDRLKLLYKLTVACQRAAEGKVTRKDKRARLFLDDLGEKGVGYVGNVMDELAVARILRALGNAAVLGKKGGDT